MEAIRQAQAEKNPYDIVLLDYNMPGMDGLELAQAITADPAIAGLQKAMLSSVGDLSDVKSIKDAGIQSYLTKPVRQAELFNCLTALMHSQPIASPTAANPIKQELKLNARILLVEDNFTNQQVTLGLLEGTDCTIDVVENGCQALEAWGRTNYNLILMDCQMPEMDGFVATSEIRRRERENKQHQPIPIIALTANTLGGDREKCIEAGMDDFLGKPFTEQQLSEVIQRWLPVVGDLAEARIEPDDGSEMMPQNAESPDLLNLAVLDKYRERERRGRKNLLSRIVGAYLQQSPLHIDKLRTAILDGNSPGIQAAAHTLKSSSANVGAMALSALCKELEVQGRNCTTEGIKERFAEIEKMHSIVCESLIQECEALSA